MAGDLYDPSLTRVIPECLRDELLMVKHYTNLPMYALLLSAPRTRMEIAHWPVSTACDMIRFNMIRYEMLFHFAPKSLYKSAFGNQRLKIGIKKN